MGKYKSESNKKTQSGYIGILLILLGTAGMLFFFTKMYFTPKTQGVPGSSAPTTQFDSYMSDIGAAKAVANQQNAKEVEINKALNSLK